MLILILIVFVIGGVIWWWVWNNLCDVIDIVQDVVVMVKNVLCCM